MTEFLRLALIIAASGALLTLGATLAARWMTEERRLARAFRHGLDGARPDATLAAHGAGRGVAISLATGRLVTVWDWGGWRMTYPLTAVLGAELDLDGAVAARAVRGEPQRRLDRTGAADREVRLRLLFDDAGHPDFDLVLWPSAAPRGGFQTPRAAIAEANRWIARVDALVRRDGAAPAQVARRPDTPPVVAAAPPTEDPHPPSPLPDDEPFGDDDDALAD